ncbi:hypothetical protein AC249_AIPGENE27397 [Exaiptasia diaphana]|nr:hypothetical protein AC249_AIPGENE27397 [Exaiptasia diaphana]
MEAGIAKTALILLSKPIKKKILENLKDGDVASQRIREVLMDSNFKIEAKQDGQNEADLKKAKHLFEEGVQLIHEDEGDEKRILDGLLEKHRLSNKSHRVLRNSSKTGSKTGVITNVEVQMTKDSALDKLRQIAYEKERKALIRSVADVNRMVWNYAHNECGKDDLEWPSLKLTKGEVHPVLHGGIRQIFVENHEGANHDSKCTADTFVESHLQRYTCATDGPIFESSSRQRSDDKPRQASVFILDENGKETKTFGRDVFTNESILTSMAVNDKSQLLIVDDHTHRLHAFNMQGDHIGLFY